MRGGRGEVSVWSDCLIHFSFGVFHLADLLLIYIKTHTQRELNNVREMCPMEAREAALSRATASQGSVRVLRGMWERHRKPR